jgi:hypothetical protein
VTAPLDPTAVLRTRLLALRADLLRKLGEADHLDAGLLALLADTETVLAALDAELPR